MFEFPLEANSYSLSLAAVGICAALLCAVIWRKRTATGATSLVLMMVGVVIWSFGYALELASQDVPTMLFWFGVEMLGITTVPVLWLVFALRYTSRRAWISPGRLALIFTIPALTLLVFYTNSWHHLYYGATSVDSSGPFPMLEIEVGPWFWFYTAYAFLSVIAVVYIFLRHSLGLPRMYRSQISVLLIAAIAPFLGHLLYQFGWTPLRNLDLAPMPF